MSRAWLFGLLCLLPAGALAQQSVRLLPVQDNTAYETPADNPETVNERSNGAGSFLFVGRTGLDAGFRVRRTLLKFDLTALPPGAQIVSATLQMTQSKAAPGSPPAQVGLYRVLQEWGEGESDGIGAEGQGDFPTAGDATWHNRLYPDQAWDTPGVSHAIEASSTVTVGQLLGDYEWPCAASLLDDLAFWQQQPGSNFGWVVIGGEESGQSAHRFNSREHPDSDSRPMLNLTYVIFRDGFETGRSCG